MKRKLILLSMTILLTIYVPTETFAQNGNFKKFLKNAAGVVGSAVLYEASIQSGCSEEEAATAVEAATWLLGGDESKVEERVKWADGTYTVDDLNTRIANKAGEAIVNYQEKKEQQEIQEIRERNRYRYENNSNYESDNNYENNDSYESSNSYETNNNVLNTFNEMSSEVLEEKTISALTATTEYVDLGLSVKWATCNIGADTPDECGYYFAWGEIKIKTEYKTDNSLTYGQNINGFSGSAQYDAATANLGSNWRMPTELEMQELLNNCLWIWTTLSDGVSGYTVIGHNGNSIFLPAAGCYKGTSLDLVCEYGKYWTSSPSENYSFDACALDFSSNNHDCNHPYRNVGFTIRPVLE